MTGRLWYPQLDIYDSIRRMAGLLFLWPSKSSPSVERLYIADFYLANPPLLHKTHMPNEVRKEFNTLGVIRPEKSFVSYPSAPLLFQKMEEVQKQAFRTLTGKGLIDLSQLERGQVKVSDVGSAVFTEKFAPLFTAVEERIAKFIVRSFIGSSDQINVLRRDTGLRRAGG
jgi:hypothetical protein